MCTYLGSDAFTRGATSPSAAVSVSDSISTVRYRGMHTGGAVAFACGKRVAAQSYFEHRCLIVRFVSMLIILFAATTSAFAHAHLDHASPAAGSTLAQAPNEIVLTFTSEIEPAFSSIEVRDAKGALMHSGKAAVDGKRTQMRLPLDVLPPGTYKVIWQVLSVDTHRSKGDFTFRIGP